MIKCELNKVEIEGTKCILLSELSTIVHTLFTAEEFDEEEVKEAVEEGMCSEEELKKMGEELAQKLKKDEKLRGFKEFLDTIFNENTPAETAPKDGKDEEA
jgi:hypothetical protein